MHLTHCVGFLRESSTVFGRFFATFLAFCFECAMGIYTDRAVAKLINCSSSAQFNKIVKVKEIEKFLKGLEKLTNSERLVLRLSDSEMIYMLCQTWNNLLAPSASNDFIDILPSRGLNLNNFIAFIIDVCEITFNKLVLQLIEEWKSRIQNRSEVLVV